MGKEVPDDLYRLFVERVRDYAMFFLDKQGSVATWNDGAEAIKGYTPEEVLGKHFGLFYPPDEVEARKPQYALRVAASDGRFEDEGWRVRKGGGMFWASVVITSIKHVDGSILGFAKITRDLTERKHAEAAVRESEERLHGLLDSIEGHAVVELDRTGRITLWPAAAQRITGYAPDDVVGAPHTILYSEAAPAEFAPVVRKAQLRHKDGRSIPVELAIRPIHRGGRVRAYALVATLLG